MTQTVPTLPLTVDEAAVRAALPSLDVLGTLRRMFASLAAARAVQPPQTLTLFPDQAGDFITYLGARATFVLIDVTSAGRVSIPSPSTGVPDDVHSITTSASRTQASTLAATRVRGSSAARPACSAALPASAGEYTRIVSQSRSAAVCFRCARPTAPA
ncbi:ornithine cyclodeaminase family protein, partial [Burkholderia cenocepacia]|nr:ornithine cyclodeaminase family protein [Burkholderia cenocepacia]